MATETQPCCPQGFPAAWQEKEISWQDKPFVKARVRSFLHVPLNYTGVLARQVRLIEAAGARPEEMVVLADENSLWGADLYVAAAADVPGAQMARLSGEYLSKVFEGPYRNIPQWIAEMKQYVRSRGKEMKSLYFSYLTCPKCARRYGKNYVALVAQV
jgi:hypothetical protein